MPEAELSIDVPLLLRQIRVLGAIGHDAALGGRTRIALTDDEKASNTKIMPCVSRFGGTTLVLDR